jgi:hypothetical protein
MERNTYLGRQTKTKAANVNMVNKYRSQEKDYQTSPVTVSKQDLDLLIPPAMNETEKEKLREKRKAQKKARKANR